MKLKRLAAVGATLAIVVGSVVGVSVAASAVPVPIDEIGEEGLVYPEGIWFIGDPAGPPLTQDTTGLTIPGRNQLLYGERIQIDTGAEFTEFIAGTSFDGDGPLIFQIPVFFGLDFTTLYPADLTVPLAETTWYSSNAVGGLVEDVAYSLEDIAAEFDAQEGGLITAYGVLVTPEESAVLRSVTSGGTTWTFATPVEAVIPTPIQDPVTFTG